MQDIKEIDICLKPTWFLDSDEKIVSEFARSAASGAETETEIAVRLYYAVRDEIRYDPYNIEMTQRAFRASTIISRKYGYCVAKAIALVAAARSLGIAARLGFADVRNHLTTERLKRLMKTDLFIFHGYSEIFIGGKWVKATPTFNLSLCERFGVKALEFDGKSDALLHPFDSHGRKHMEYVHDHGPFTDVPYELIMEMFRKHYPIYFSREPLSGNFENEAAESKAAG